MKSLEYCFSVYLINLNEALVGLKYCTDDMHLHVIEE